MDDAAHRDDTTAGAQQANQAPDSPRRRLIRALLDLDEALLGGLDIRFELDGRTQVTLHRRTLDEATSLISAFGLSTRPDGVRVVTGESDTIAVQYATAAGQDGSGAHVSGGLTVTWVIEGATAVLDELKGGSRPRTEE
jgi:hypothetical protein